MSFILTLIKNNNRKKSIFYSLSYPLCYVSIEKRQRDNAAFSSAITLFVTGDNNDVNLVHLKSMRGEFVDLNYYAKEISVDILNEAFPWMNPCIEDDEADILSALTRYIDELKKIPKADQDTTKILTFIKDHNWEGIDDCWGKDKLNDIIESLTDGATNGKADFIILHCYIPKKMAKATKIMVHWVDGFHCASAYNGASICSVNPSADESLTLSAHKYFQNTDLRRKHVNIQVELKVVYNIDSDLKAFGEEMIILSRIVQLSGERQKAHTVKECAKSVILELNRALVEQSGFLLGDSNDWGLPEALLKMFPHAKYPNPHEAQTVFNESRVLSPEDSRVVAGSTRVVNINDVANVSIEKLV